jgi:hypothetical protein
MEEKSTTLDANRRVETDFDERTEQAITASSRSSTQADEHPYGYRSPHTTHEKETEHARRQGTPDIDHDEIEAVVPGHSLDVELAKVPDSFSLTPSQSQLAQPRSWPILASPLPL